MISFLNVTTWMLLVWLTISHFTPVKKMTKTFELQFMSQKPFTWIEKNHLKAKLNQSYLSLKNSTAAGTIRPLLCCIVNVLLATKMSVRRLSGSMKYIQNLALRSPWR